MTQLSKSIQEEKQKKKKLNINEKIIEFQEISKFNHLSNTSKLTFKGFGNDPIVEQFDKHRKSLKAVKSNENGESYKDYIPQLEIKLRCTEDYLKKKKKKLQKNGTTKFEKQQITEFAF